MQTRSTVVGKHHFSQSGRNSQQGIGLMLTAALLVVLGMVGSVLFISEKLKDSVKPHAALQKQLHEIGLALRAYQQANHHLPCVAPLATAHDQSIIANRTETSTIVLSPGQQLPSCVYNPPLNVGLAGTSRITVAGNVIRVGAVPTQTLGLPAYYGTDPWNNKILYVVTENLTNPFLFATGQGVLQVRDDAGLRYSSAAYVLVSHGANKVGAYSATNGSLIAPCSQTAYDDGRNCDFGDPGNAPLEFFTRSVDLANTTRYFDDQIYYAAVDGIAQSRNRPCYVGVSGPARWTVGSATCENAGWSAMLDGQSQAVSRVSGASSSGNATLTCVNGGLSYSAVSCVP
jgi:hypothetical protein